MSEEGSEGSTDCPGCSGRAATDDWLAASEVASEGWGCDWDISKDAEVAAIGIESELVGAGVVAGAVVAAAATEATACDSLTSGAGPGATAAGGDGSRFAKAEDCATDEETTLLVPIAEDAASVGDTCWASCAEDEGGGGGGGGGWAALVCC